MRTATTTLIKAAAARLSPRQRQFAAAAVIAATTIGLLWLVFSLSSTKPVASSTASTAARTKPTNVDLMAPGQQIEPLDQWVSTAGRKLAQYENDRSEQQHLNRERQQFEATTMQHFAELEKKLTAAPPPPPAEPVRTPPAASVPASTPASALPPPVPKYPPDSTLMPGGLPPPPAAPAAHRGQMPDGLPPTGAGDIIAPSMPSLMRVAVLSPSRPAADSAGPPGAKPYSAAPTGSYLPVSTTQGVLLGGLDAPTGGQAQSNPQPVLIRLSDTSILPNRYRADYRECFVIGAGYGDISSERAYLRTETLSCVRNDGTAMEVKVQGSIFGEDGKLGMRGHLVTKQGQMLANALLAGVVGGIGQGLSTANTSYSTSALGQVATTSGAEAYKAGVGTGVGRALDRLAQYYIKLAEQTFPVIEIDAGRTIDVVITHGVKVEAQDVAHAALDGAAPRDSDAGERLHDRVQRGNDDED